MRLRWTEELKTRFADAVEQGGGLHHVGLSSCHAAHVQSVTRIGDRVIVAYAGIVYYTHHREGRVQYQITALPVCSHRSPIRASTDATTLLLGQQATAQQILMHMGVPELTMAHVKSHLQQQRIRDKSQSAEHRSDSRQASEGAAFSGCMPRAPIACKFTCACYLLRTNFAAFLPAQPVPS